jgi:hypothetical protein
MGEEPVLDTAALPARYDAWDVLEQRQLPPLTRLTNGIAFSKLGTELAAAARTARSE